MDFLDFLALRKHADPPAQKLLSKLNSWRLPFGFVRSHIIGHLREGGAPRQELEFVKNLYVEYLAWMDEMKRRAALDPLVRDDFMRPYRPYLFEKLRLPGNVWLPLTRDCKPFGVPREQFVRYEDYAHQAVLFFEDPTRFRGIFLNETDPTRRWLYDDGPWPASDYYHRLAKLEREGHRGAWAADLTRWACGLRTRPSSLVDAAGAVAGAGHQRDTSVAC